jgi:hypothetical protein
VGGARQQAGEHGHGDHGRDHADPHLAERERGRRGRHGDVAGGHQADPARPRRAADLRDHRLGRRPDPLQDRGHLVDALVGRARPAGLLEVHARAEHPPGVAEHDHPDGVVGQRGVQVPEQLPAQLGGQGVAVGRGVQRDRRDARGDVEVHQLGHVVRP